MAGWCGEGERTVEISTDTAVWRYRKAIPRRDVSEADRGGMPIAPVSWVLARDPLGRFDPQALLRTDPVQDPVQILRWFVQGWQLGVTFRAERQWSDRAVARTTPCLLGLFSLVTLPGQQLAPQARRAVATSAWHRKQRPASSDTPAAVRHEIWREQGFVTSRNTSSTRKLRPALRDGTTHALCQAARWPKSGLQAGQELHW